MKKIKIIFGVLSLLFLVIGSSSYAQNLNSGNLTNYCPTSATECDLNFGWVESIAVNTFINHTGLKHLNLEDNKIVTIESGVFNGLGNLETLYFDNGQLTNIETGVFNGLGNLETLYLDSNHIVTSINSGTFSGLNKLTYLGLEGNQISNIDSDTFLGLTKLTHLSINHNSIGNIEPRTFHGLTDLITLNLSHNLITIIEPGTFNGLNNLKRLFFASNQIKDIPCDIMNLTSLNAFGLYINDNPLNEATLSLDMKTFLNDKAGTTYILDSNDPYQVCGVFPVIGELNSSNIVNAYYNCPINATECDLRSKSIKDIAVNTFVHHTGLIFLDLQDNQIETIKSGAFNGLSNLTLLAFDDNKIINIEPGAFGVLENLIELYLRRNLIETIKPKTFFGLTNLESLYLSENNISSIQSGNFNGLGKLGELSLDFNQITTIQPGAFIGIENLKYLELGGNKITSIQSGAFIGIDSLDYLSLGLNQLSIIEPGAFIGLDSLQDFSLYSNKLLDLPCDIMNLTNLTYFNVDNNFLTGSTLSLDMKSFLNDKAGTIYTLSPNDPYQVCGVFGNTTTTTNGHGGGTSLGKDYCPNGDNSLSYYDGSCETSSTEKNNHGSADIQTTGSYTQEFIDAYLWGHKRGFTTAKTIQRAHIEKHLTRKELAKIFTIYSTKILKKEINPEISCDFIDTKTLGEKDQEFIIHSCQLGLMGLNSDGVPTDTFNPRNEVTRAEFGTAFSRLLYGNKNNTDDTNKRYTKHLEALKNDGIMNLIDVPEMKELFGNVLLMLMRTQTQVNK